MAYVLTPVDENKVDLTTHLIPEASVRPYRVVSLASHDIVMLDCTNYQGNKFNILKTKKLPYLNATVKRLEKWEVYCEYSNYHLTDEEVSEKVPIIKLSKKLLCPRNESDWLAVYYHFAKTFKDTAGLCSSRMLNHFVCKYQQGLVPTSLASYLVKNKRRPEPQMFHVDFLRLWSVSTLLNIDRPAPFACMCCTSTFTRYYFNFSLKVRDVWVEVVVNVFKEIHI